MGRDKGKSVASSSTSNKGKGKQKKATQSRAPLTQALLTNQEPKAYGVTLKTPEVKRRWSHLVGLKHKHCRFLDHETIVGMGIADDVVTLMGNGGFTKVFQANLLTYHGPTVEFLSTVEVLRSGKTPSMLRFQLGNVQRSLTMEELNELIGGDNEGHFSGDHTPNMDDLWKAIVYLEKERMVYYDPRRSKASSVRNPAFRYLHRLITSTIVGRGDSGTFGTVDMHLFWSCINEINQDAALWLSEHFESQALLHGSQKIGCGAWITPMCHKFRVPLPKDPVSRDILLDRAALQRQGMLSHEEGYI